MSLFGYLLIAFGLLIGRAAIRSARKPAEQAIDDDPYGDCFPEPLVNGCAGDDLAGAPGARVSSFHNPLITAEARQDHVGR